MSFAQHGPGLFVVRYDSAEALAPDRQRELELVLREASRAGGQGVVSVAVSARGFSTAVIRDRQVAVKPFPEEAAAIAWVRELVPAP